MNGECRLLILMVSLKTNEKEMRKDIEQEAVNMLKKAGFKKCKRL